MNRMGELNKIKGWNKRSGKTHSQKEGGKEKKSKRRKHTCCSEQGGQKKRGSPWKHPNEKPEGSREQ